MSMKKCKECGSEVSSNALICPKCGNQLKRKKGCLLSITSLFAVIIFFCIIIATTNPFDTDNEIQKTISGVSDESEYITLEEYNKIEIGMSYKKVKKIIGSNGEQTSVVGSGDYILETYTWYGNSVAGSCAVLSFENGKLTAMTQSMIK